MKTYQISIEHSYDSHGFKDFAWISEAAQLRLFKGLWELPPAGTTSIQRWHDMEKNVFYVVTTPFSIHVIRDVVMAAFNGAGPVWDLTELT